MKLATGTSPISACTELHYLPTVSLSDLEKSYILKALEFHQGNRDATAEALGIDYKTLYRKMVKHDILEAYRLGPRRRWAKRPEASC